ncbi:MazG-like family protein [Effusibacillus lacus]|uniref:Nucleotide pyrophosphohydrolase n=1 Tax=Effusibacillus lacus TaxID=1348429 RepID=A0A292YC14_9BACL|nr:MazG-like family protein [Effusibacillus lacus]TCS74477.1 MazG-like nucleotide pyrophosphohydrolase family protein [Effusibacillus lacus]GAX88652.1 nucleotide pyrophosphohydrolase [Effusibacillus lacus]
MKTSNMKTITLPRLNKLSPTLESTALKLLEEAGELAQAIGKFRNLSGEANEVNEGVMERIASELADTAQTCITMMYVLEEKYGVDIDKVLQEHIKKLRSKGYCD